MDTIYIVLIVIIGVLLLGLSQFFALGYIAKKTSVGKRYDKNPLFKYYSPEDFNLTAEQIEIACRKKNHIRGVIYSKKEITPQEPLIIFCHGLGPGHVSYTQEIAYFCNLGYTVLAPDYEGCNLSDGKSLKSFKNGADTVSDTIRYARQNLTQYSKIYLVGHSLGGYSALCAGAGTCAVDKIVAISAPASPQDALLAVAERLTTVPFSRMVYPFILLFNKGASSVRAAETITVPTLLVHGEDDELVPPKFSVFYNLNTPQVTKYLVKGKRHNPYLTAQAEEKREELSQSFNKYKRRRLKKDYFNTFDYVASAEEDVVVMDEIARFLSKN